MNGRATIDRRRMPTIDEVSFHRLKYLIDQSSAPKFNNLSGSHLEQYELDQLESYHKSEIEQQGNTRISANTWLKKFIADCFKKVPFYRQYRQINGSFISLPTISRRDLSKDIVQFIPDDLPVERLISYETSGTTGHSLMIPSHPMVAARYSCFHKKSLLWNGITTETFNSELAIVLAGYQQKCFTYASISPYLNNKGLAKLNFHPNDWHHPDDRSRYLDTNKPDLISGDPVSLYELSKLPFTHSPKALLSTSMTLFEGQKKLFQERFDCPVIDLYSMNESGPIGCTIPNKSGFKLLQSKLFVEVLDSAGNSVGPGERGEITLTGGFNDYLPLLRYRTGDYGRLVLSDNNWMICDLEGRPPVQFRTSKMQWLNNVDITHLLKALSIPQFSLHQSANGHLTMKVLGNVDVKRIHKILTECFGYPVQIQSLDHSASGHKLIQYTSDLRREG